MSFNFGTPKTTGQASMFPMTPPTNTSSGQPQLGLFGATAQSPAPAFGTLPAPTFGVSPSLPSSTPILGSTTATKPAFNLGSMNTSFSLGAMPSFGLPATNVQPSNTVAAAKTSVPTGFNLSTMPTSQAPTTQTAPGFSLGNTNQGATGFSLGNTNQGATGFSLGNTNQGATGFSLGNTNQGATGFSLSGTTQATTGFSLANTTQASTGFSLGNTTQAATGINLGKTTQAATGFSLGNTTQASTGFSLGNTTQASTGFSLGNTTQAATGISLGSTTQAATGFVLGTTPASSSSFSLSATPASTTGFSLGTTSTTGFALGTSGTTTVQTVATTTVTTAQVPPTSQSDSQSSSAQPTNFQQLVDLINNWTVSLENQEKQFLNQANEITVWDNILTNQSTKLVKLYDMLEHKEKEQLEIEQELDFLLSQQKELEDCLVPLEQELQSAEVLSSLNNEREPIYKAAQEIDNQVKQMSNDIKEIVNNLNKTNSKKDSDDDLDTICRILNCHMTALQYIEHNAENLSVMVKEVNEEHTRFLSAVNDSSFMLKK